MTNTSHTTPEETQRFHGERVEARQRERADTHFFENAQDFRVDLDETPGEFFHRVGKQAQISRATDALFTAILLDIIAHAALTEPEAQDRIDLIDEANEPPFFKFWAKLNKGLRAAGKPDAGYKAAHIAFEGGETPVGALTFIGKEWDGLRAVPGPGVNGTVSYYGEFREVSDAGTVWRVVANKHGLNIAYVSAEAALVSAQHAKKHSEDHS